MDEGSSEIEAIDIQFIRPEALGEPGQRRFRLLVVINGHTVIAWMEKEQVGRLGELLLDVLERLPAADEPEATKPSKFYLTRTPPISSGPGGWNSATTKKMIA